MQCSGVFFLIETLTRKEVTEVVAALPSTKKNADFCLLCEKKHADFSPNTTSIYGTHVSMCGIIIIFTKQAQIIITARYGPAVGLAGAVHLN
jgi:hypothetical protein